MTTRNRKTAASKRSAPAQATVVEPVRIQIDKPSWAIDLDQRIRGFQEAVETAGAFVTKAESERIVAAIDEYKPVIAPIIANESFATLASFPLNQLVELRLSLERGRVIERTVSIDRPTRYRVRYLDGTGCQREGDFEASAIAAIDE